MKFIKYSLFFSILFVTSCGEKFLDISPSSAISTENPIRTVSDMEALLVGAYNQMQANNYYGRYGILVPDVMSDDVKENATANRAREWAQYNGDALNFIGEGIWTDIYQFINNLNTIINSTVEFPTATTKKSGDQFKGEALALRGLAHFDLCRFYGQHYGFTADASHLGVPYVLKFDKNAKSSRLTVAQVYKQAIADIQAGIALMTINRGTGYMSPMAAQALLARIHFYMGDYNKAEEFANTVINSNIYKLTPRDQFVAKWLDSGTPPDAIFEVIMTATDNPGNESLSRLYIAEGYGDYLPTDDLRLLIDSADLRGSLFKLDPKLTGIYGKYRVNKHPSVTGDDRLPIIRLTEIYLIRAESRARNGNETGAIADLMTVRSRAWATAKTVTATGNALLEEIIKERRIELCYEGVRLWDLMRLKRDVVRKNCTGPVCTIKYPNPRFILPIPFREIDANPSMIQNPGY
jgi:hypothetical protein